MQFYNLVCIKRQLPKRIVYFTCRNTTIGSVIMRLRLIFVSKCGKQHGLNSAGGHLQLIMFNYLRAQRGYQMFSAPPSPSAALLTGRCLSSAGWQSPPYVWPHFCSTSYLFGTSCWRGVSGCFHSGGPIAQNVHNSILEAGDLFVRAL